MNDEIPPLPKPGDPGPGDLLGPPSMLEQISAGGLFVNVDYLDLLEHFNGDEAKVFELLGKLKDLLR